MNKTFKRVISGLVSASIAFSAMSVTAVLSSATTFNFYGNAVNSKNIMTGYDSGNKPVVWLNGGKANVSIPGTAATVAVDGKTVNLSLIAKTLGTSQTLGITEGETVYNDVTASKSVVWVASDKAVTIDGKAVSAKPKTTGTALKASAGKISSNKAGSDKGYVVAYEVGKDSNNKATYTAIVCQEVTVKTAPTTVTINSDPTKASVVKATNLAIGGVSDRYYVSGSVKTGTVSTDDLTYTISAGAGAEVAIVKSTTIGSSNITIGVSGGTDISLGYSTNEYTYSAKGSSVTATTAELANGFVVIGTGLVKDKAAKSAITVTNNQSGKSAKMTATINNSVNAGVALKEQTLTTSATKAETTSVKLIDSTTGVTKNISADLTVKAQAAVYTSAPTIASLALNDKGKLATGATGYKAVMNKDMDTVTITVPKGTAAGTAVYVVVAYGSSKSEMIVFRAVTK